MLAAACFAFTIAVYWVVKRIYKARPKVYLSPLLITPTIVIAVLIWTDIPYESYNAGAGWISNMIGPGTVAFAVPLYKNFHVLKKHALAIGVSVFAGSTVSIVSSIWLAQKLQLNQQLIDSLAPRSATTPIALAVSGMSGGLPAVTALIVFITGLLGILLGPAIIRIFRIQDDVARGVLFGTSAHNAGTSKAFEFSSVTGSISSISMILTAFFTLCSAPWILSWLTG